MFNVNNNSHIFSFHIFILQCTGYILNSASFFLFLTILLFKFGIICCFTMGVPVEKGFNIPKYVRIKLKEELPPGTLVLNIRGFLNSGSVTLYYTDEINNPSQKERMSIIVSSLNLVSEVAVVNRLFRLNKEAQSIVTNVVIDRDTLCSKDQLCCRNPTVKIDNGFLDSPMRLPISNSVQLYKPYQSKTADLCLIQFRVIFSIYHEHANGNGEDDAEKNQIKGSREEMAYITVEVELLDINDNSPQFILPTPVYTDHMPKTVTLLHNPVPVIEISIEESISLNSCINLPKAFDPDSEKYDVTEYRLDSLSPSDILTLKHKLSYSNLNNVNKYELPFSLEQKACTNSLLLSYNEVSINTPLQDTDETFELQSSIEQLTPSLKVVNYLDREVTEYFWIKLLAVDGTKYLYSDASNHQDITGNTSNRYSVQIPQHTGTVLIRIRILDVNDNTPVVPRTLNLDISEDAKVGTTLGRINGSDPDFGDNGRLYYRLMIDPTIVSNFPFAVDSQTGTITVNRPLDADRLPASNKHIRFKILTSDFGKPISHSAYTIIDVRVNDINDETPQIKVVDLESHSNPPYPTVLENRPPGQLVAFVTATDADSGLNGALSCRIDNPKFKLEQIVISKSDPNGHTHNKINSYNFEPMNIQPLKDPPNTLDFKVITSVELDREMSALEAVEIMCTDQPLNSATVRTGSIQFFVTVLDENDNSPTFNTNKFKLDITENTPSDEVIFVFNATDLDYQNYPNGGSTHRINQPNFHPYIKQQNMRIAQLTERIKYFIDSRGEQYFRIDTDTGILYSRVKIDRRVLQEIEFNVTANDNGRPPKNSTAEVIINIIDQNDHAPQFEKPIFYFNLSEDLPINSIVATLVAHDDDVGKNAEITYKLDDLHGNAIKTFRLDRNNGTLWLRAPLDREKLDNYAFKVLAFDHGIPKQSSSCQVHIKVYDVNDNPPKFVYPTHSNHTVYASIFTNPGIPLVKLTATDADEGVNSQLTFYLYDESNTKQIFTINPHSGELCLQPTDDPYSIEGRHQLKFEVRDAGTPSLSGYANINIILDRNSPQLASFIAGKYHHPSMELPQPRNIYRPAPHKNDDDVIHEPSNIEFKGIHLRQDISGTQSVGSTHAQPIHSISAYSNENARRSDKVSARSNQKASTHFNLEKIWIVIICLIAISTLVAFVFLVAITLTRQKVTTCELRQPSNHLRENYNLCSTEQCSNSQFSVNTQRITNISNAYSPTKYRTLEKVDHINNNHIDKNQSHNLYSSFIKYDTNTDSNMKSPHQLEIFSKDHSVVNTDMFQRPVYNYNMPITANSLQFNRKFPQGENFNDSKDFASEKWVSLLQVQHSAPASPNDYFTQRYKTIDQYQMNTPNQKYEILQPYKCQVNKSDDKISVNQNIKDGILKECITETNENFNNEKDDDNDKHSNMLNKVDSDDDRGSSQSCSTDIQGQSFQVNGHNDIINDNTCDGGQYHVQNNTLIPNSINKLIQLPSKIICDSSEQNQHCRQQRQQVNLIAKSPTEHNLMNINSKCLSPNDTVTSLSSHVSTFI
ncbi:unnamed protein product [Heterobilharzia americana]|nr:unnamed protein product [Heterobilharzia americana]